MERLNITRWIDGIQCRRCNGRGLSTMTDGDRANLIDMKRTTFVMTWSNRLSVLKSYLLEYERDVWDLRL